MYSSWFACNCTSRRNTLSPQWAQLISTQGLTVSTMLQLTTLELIRHRKTTKNKQTPMMTSGKIAWDVCASFARIFFVLPSCVTIYTIFIFWSNLIISMNFREDLNFGFISLFWTNSVGLWPRGSRWFWDSSQIHSHCISKRLFIAGWYSSHMYSRSFATRLFQTVARVPRHIGWEIVMFGLN